MGFELGERGLLKLFLDCGGRAWRIISVKISLPGWDQAQASGEVCMSGVMSKIKVEWQPSAERLNELGVFGWPIWSKEAS